MRISVRGVAGHSAVEEIAAFLHAPWVLTIHSKGTAVQSVVPDIRWLCLLIGPGLRRYSRAPGRRIATYQTPLSPPSLVQTYGRPKNFERISVAPGQHRRVMRKP